MISHETLHAAGLSTGVVVLHVPARDDSDRNGAGVAALTRSGGYLAGSMSVTYAVNGMGTTRS